MSKRARLSTDEAKRAGLHAWETNDGRRWLMKALNPNDVAITSTGIPSLSSRNISVLNWQGEYTMSVPANLTSEVPAYDTSMYLFQHPLIFGVSASRPQGTIDLQAFRGRFHLYRKDKHYLIEVAEQDSSSPLALTSCARFLNNQLNPDAFGKQNTLNGKTNLFKLLTQKSRICYGGATIIPTCSDQYNSGSMAVCQQIFNPRRSVLSANADISLYSYFPNDFPNTSDAVQNPQMYYGKFQDGAYIPYKLVEPLNADYVNSESAIITRAPYWITAVSLLICGTGNEDKVIQLQNPTISTPTGQTGGVLIDFDATEYVDEEVDDNPSANPPVVGYAYWPVGIRFSIMSYTGQKGYVTFGRAEKAGIQKSIFFENETTDDPFSTVACGTDTPWIEGTAGKPLTYGIMNDNKLGVYFELPECFTMYDLVSNQPLANPYGSHYVTQDADTPITTSTISYIPPYNGSQIVAIHMSGVSNTAPIKMILRYGVEILLTASSIYSPFKFISPKYDESAIKSYARCIRNMKDAYFANAGSTIGQVDFVNKILNLIETDVPDDLRVLNQGGQWTGVVGAF